MVKKHSKSGGTRYEVGYGRPPKSRQFKKGQSGNPQGVNRKASASIVPDLKPILERALNAKVNLRRGERDEIVTKAEAIIHQMTEQAVNGDRNARRDLITLCEKFGVDLANRKALEGALDDALSVEDETILADFVKRHGGRGRHCSRQSRQRRRRSRFAERENAKLLAPPAENLTDSQICHTEENSHA